MPFIYCTECGYKNTFTTQKAKFCAGCGQPLLKEVTRTARAKQVASSSPQSAHHNLEPSEEIPNIQKLEYTVDLASKNPTIGDLINTKNTGSDKTKRNTPADFKQLSLEELEAQSIRDCASSANQSSD